MKEEFINQEIDNTKVTETKSSKALKEFFSWVKVVVVAAIIAYIISNFIIINANIPTGSMKNLIMPGDRMIGMRTSYWFKDPERGDVVIFEYPDDPNQIFVKRLIGMPGDTVTIKDSKIYINDSKEPLKEDYLPEEWTENNGKTVVNEITGKTVSSELVYEVPEGHYFMLGDNRNDSFDARGWTNKFVSRDQIIAKGTFTYWPFSHAKFVGSAEY